MKYTKFKYSTELKGPWDRTTLRVFAGISRFDCPYAYLTAHGVAAPSSAGYRYRGVPRPITLQHKQHSV